MVKHSCPSISMFLRIRVMIILKLINSQADMRSLPWCKDLRVFKDFKVWITLLKQKASSGLAVNINGH